LEFFFIDHSDLRRILTDYGFKGSPLNKCFPLTGYLEVKYNENQKRMVFDFVKQLTQEFRNFSLISFWTNIK